MKIKTKTMSEFVKFIKESTKDYVKYVGNTCYKGKNTVEIVKPDNETIEIFSHKRATIFATGEEKIEVIGKSVEASLRDHNFVPGEYEISIKLYRNDSINTMPLGKVKIIDD